MMIYFCTTPVVIYCFVGNRQVSCYQVIGRQVGRLVLGSSLVGWQKVVVKQVFTRWCSGRLLLGSRQVGRLLLVSRQVGCYQVVGKLVVTRQQVCTRNQVVGWLFLGNQTLQQSTKCFFESNYLLLCLITQKTFLEQNFASRYRQFSVNIEWNRVSPFQGQYCNAFLTSLFKWPFPASFSLFSSFQHRYNTVDDSIRTAVTNLI